MSAWAGGDRTRTRVGERRWTWWSREEEGEESDKVRVVKGRGEEATSASGSEWGE